jgi:hypothetical protein
MRPISSHSQHAVPFSRRAAPRHAAAAGLSAAALIVVAACGSASNGPANSNGSAANPLTPHQALDAAATSTAKVTSAVETLTVKAAGLQGEDTSGTIQVQLKPAVELGADLRVNASGKSSSIKEVLTPSAIYFSSPVLAGVASKPWVKIPLSALKGTAGASFGQLFHSLQSNSFTNQTELLTVAKNAQIVGKSTVDGVPTTEYAGSFKASSGLKALPASFRKIMSAELQALGTSTISFHVWIDGQKHVRKIVETETISGETVHTTVNITGINQPVHITVPPASQTGSMPGGL